MAISDNEWGIERERLERVIKVIDKQLDERKDEVIKYGKDVKETQRSMWEDTVHGFMELDEIVEAKQYLDGISLELRKQNFARQQVRRFEKMRPSPYFGRFDFIEEGFNDTELIYVGISTLKEKSTDDFLVYDWRAPVCSMFYEAETGLAQYASPGGIIKGNIALKRQYRITNGTIEYMFDSSIKIDDDILQSILSRSVDDKMRTIVNSIQREQNRVIRDDSHKLLVVQGPAGSGKTSIALHRIAYLLYKHRDTISARNIVIFSPNRIFNDYISDVLPELGEENMLQTTFREYAESLLPKGLVIEDMNDQMEFLLSKRGLAVYNARAKSMKYKASADFVRVIKNYAGYLENEGIIFKDLYHDGNLIISKEELLELLHTDYAILPLLKRLDRIKQRLYLLIGPLEKEYTKEKEEELADSGEYVDAGEIKARAVLAAREHFSGTKQQIEQMTGLDLYDTYLGLFENKTLFARIADGTGLPAEYKSILEYSSEKLGMRQMDYEDAAALLLLESEFGGTPSMTGIKHVIIDEAQDYTPMQYEIIKQLFPDGSFTLLGDLNQSINSYMSVSDYNTVIETLQMKNPQLIELTKSYRSTVQITRFARTLLEKAVDAEFVEREGELPVICKAADEDTVINMLPESIRVLKDKGARSIAIICKSARESLHVYEKLKQKHKVTLVTKDDDEFVRGIVVIPSYLAKGLEFDAVIVFNASKEAYGHESERKLLYTVCTRALHHLQIYIAGEPSPFIGGQFSNYFKA